MTHTTSTLHTTEQREAFARHAEECQRIIAECRLCQEHFGLERHT